MQKRTVTINGQKTAVSVEDEFWDALRDIARSRGLRLYQMVEEIHRGRDKSANLSRAVRLYVLRHFRDAAGQPANYPQPPRPRPARSLGRSAS